MQIDLTPEQRSFIEYGIEQGRYQNEEEAVREALALWVDRERARAELLAAIDAGDNSPEGEDIVLSSEEDVAEFVNGIRERTRAKLAKR
jgi:putative addiction module CopG family antidote